MLKVWPVRRSEVCGTRGEGVYDLGEVLEKAAIVGVFFFPSVCSLLVVLVGGHAVCDEVDVEGEEADDEESHGCTEKEEPGDDLVCADEIPKDEKVRGSFGFAGADVDEDGRGEFLRAVFVSEDLESSESAVAQRERVQD